MAPFRTTTSTIRPDRLGLKLAGLFAVSFAFALLAFIAYGLLSLVGEGSSAPPPPDPAVAIVIDPRIESDLAKVLAFDTLPAPDNVSDPFTDRGGLSRTASAAAVLTAQRAASDGTVAAVKPPGSTAQGTTGPGSGGTTPPAGPAPGSSSATRQRYELWLNTISITGDDKFDPKLFGVDDLLPVGIVDGGSGSQNVMFFSQALNKIVSFPVGTVFYDGWLVELRPDGVVFGSNDKSSTYRLRSWTRSISALGRS